MTQVRRFWPILTSTHRYDKSLSTRGRDAGQIIEAPILAYLINLDQEIAPGLCWQERDDLALASIRKLKQLACATGAELWPNHDLAFFRTRRPFPQFYD